MPGLKLTFTNELWYWRGPSPFHFVSIPKGSSEQIKEVASRISYGWGVIPAKITIGKTTWTTSLIPKDGLYLVPIKNAIRFGEDLILGDAIKLKVEIGA